MVYTNIPTNHPIFSHLPWFDPRPLLTSRVWHPTAVSNRTSKRKSYLCEISTSGKGNVQLRCQANNGQYSGWLVVDLPPLKNISQIGSSSQLLGKIKNVWNHQTDGEIMGRYKQQYDIWESRVVWQWAIPGTIYGENDAWLQDIGLCGKANLNQPLGDEDKLIKQPMFS